jgi:hypothetical protein
MRFQGRKLLRIRSTLLLGVSFAAFIHSTRVVADIVVAPGGVLNIGTGTISSGAVTLSGTSSARFSIIGATTFGSINTVGNVDLGNGIV